MMLPCENFGEDPAALVKKADGKEEQVWKHHKGIAKPKFKHTTKRRSCWCTKIQSKYQNGKLRISLLLYSPLMLLN
jgi:hypothetical protein